MIFNLVWLFFVANILWIILFVHFSGFSSPMVWIVEMEVYRFPGCWSQIFDGLLGNYLFGNFLISCVTSEKIVSNPTSKIDSFQPHVRKDGLQPHARKRQFPTPRQKKTVSNPTSEKDSFQPHARKRQFPTPRQKKTVSNPTSEKIIYFRRVDQPQPNKPHTPPTHKWPPNCNSIHKQLLDPSSQIGNIGFKFHCP